MKVSICVLTYNRCELLRALLDDLKGLTYEPIEIVVVDNRSEDGTREMIVGEFKDFRYIRMDRNIGVDARNVGMRSAVGDVIITLDDDVRGITDPDIHLLVQWFSSKKSVGAINFKVVEPKTGAICNWVHHCKAEEFHDREFETYEITEGAVAFRRIALDSAGYYPEGFFISHEGPDLAFRIIESGFEVLYKGGIVVTHYEAREGRTNWRNYYYDTRNQFWLAARNFPFPYAIWYLSRGLSSMFLYAARDGYLRYWGKAVIDGIVGMGEIVRKRKVLSDRTMTVIRRIDSMRPGIGYMIQKRLLRNGIRI